MTARESRVNASREQSRLVLRCKYVRQMPAGYRSIEIPNRALFKASEVCDLIKVQPYVLRSWEAEFPELGVSKAAGGPRVYRRADVEQVARIKHLLLVEGLTLAGRAAEARGRSDAGRGRRCRSSTSSSAERARTADRGQARAAVHPGCCCRARRGRTSSGSRRKRSRAPTSRRAVAARSKRRRADRDRPRRPSRRKRSR